MNSKRMIITTVIMVLSSVLLIALVGARGSFGFGKGSVVAYGEIEGQVSDNGQVTLNVKKHPEARKMQFYVTCERNGEVREGRRPVELRTELFGSIGVSQLEKLNGGVVVGYGQLVADLTSQQKDRLSRRACNGRRSTLVDAFPVGFEATVSLQDNGQTVSELKYVCGTTITRGRSPFNNGSADAGTEYECTEM